MAHFTMQPVDDESDSDTDADEQSDTDENMQNEGNSSIITRENPSNLNDSITKIEEFVNTKSIPSKHTVKDKVDSNSQTKRTL